MRMKASKNLLSKRDQPQIWTLSTSAVFRSEYCILDTFLDLVLWIQASLAD